MRILLIIIWMTMYLKSMAQDSDSWQVSYFMGKNITHKSMDIHPNNFHHGISIEYLKHTFGKKYWQYAHDYPQMGIQGTFRTLGDNTVYGQAISVLPFLEFNVWRHRIGVLQIKHGTGLAWNTKKYHALHNPDASAISTSLNATSTIDIGFLFTLKNDIHIKTGIVLHHISNGGFRQPNYGFNTFSGYLALRHFYAKNKNKKITYEHLVLANKWNMRIGTALGFYDYNAENKSIETYPQLTAILYRRHNSRFKTGLGMEMALAASNTFQASVYAEEEINFGNISTRYGFARYIWNIPRPADKFYSKIGIAYYFQQQYAYAKGLYIGSMMKAHNFRAAHIELNLGYSF